VSTHSVPLHCPYCAGERLFPYGDKHGAWECRECLRAFSVSFLGLLAPSGPTASTAQTARSTTPSTSTAGE
jgi:transposase-like protein